MSKKPKVTDDDDIWTEIARIHEEDGGKPVNQIDGLWRRKLADGWSVAVNGHQQPIKDTETNFEVAPFNAIGVRAHMPWIYLGPPGQGGVAVGEGAEDAFLLALKNTRGRE